MVRQVSERLARRAYDVTVLTRGALPTPESGVEVRAITGFRDYRRKLARLTQEAEVLMVYGQKVWCSDWLPLARVHCPVVYFPVGFDRWRRSLLHQVYYQVWQRRVCRRADALVALTEGEEAFLREWLDPSYLRHIPNGVDFPRWQNPPEDFEPPLGVPFLFHAGGYYSNKRVEDLVRVLAALRAEGVEVGLVTCGPDFRGNRSQAEQLAASLGVEKAYRALGEVSAADLKGLFHACAVYASASTFEGFGLTFLEALASGKPLVCRPVGVAPALARASNSVVLADSEEAFAAGVDRLLRDGYNPEESRRVAAAYDWERVVDQLEALYIDLL